MHRTRWCCWLSSTKTHQIGGNRNALNNLTIDDRGLKALETAFSVAICRQSGDKWQPKTLFLLFLSTFVDIINVFDCRLSGVKKSGEFRLKRLGRFVLATFVETLISLLD